jgi:hypothetical protein
VEDALDRVVADARPAGIHRDEIAAGPDALFIIMRILFADAMLAERPGKTADGAAGQRAGRDRAAGHAQRFGQRAAGDERADAGDEERAETEQRADGEAGADAAAGLVAVMIPS